MTNQDLPRMTSVDKLCEYAKQGIDGKAWYVNAKQQVDIAARILNTTPRRLADLLALFSPRVTVKRSIRFTIKYLQTGEFAHDVMQGVRASVRHYEHTGEIRGIKTRPFANAIAGDTTAVVLDVWMAFAFGIDQRSFTRKPVFAKCHKRICKVAKRLGWSNAEAQAAIWTYTVRSYGRRPGTLKLVSDSLFGQVLEQAAQWL